MKPIELATAEALRNLRTSALLTGALVLACASAGATVGLATASETSRIAEAARAQYLAGATVIEAIGPEGSRLAAIKCHALMGVDGILAAGGIMASESVRLGAEPDADLSLITVTPGYLAAAWPELQNFKPLSVVAGPDLARSGVRSEDYVEVHTLTQGRMLLRTDATPQHESTTGVDRVLALVSAPEGTVSSCLVLTRAGVTNNTTNYLSSYFGDGTSVRSALLPSTLVTSPDELLRSRLSQYGWLVSGLVCGIALLGFWFARRNEFALYRLLGLSEFSIVAMLMTELACLCLLPSQLGIVVGIAFGAASVDDLVATSLVLDILRFDALLVMLPAIALTVAPRASILPALGGR